MRYIGFVAVILSLTLLTSVNPARRGDPFADYPVYSGTDLGVNYAPSKTSFKVWAPTATAVKLRLYDAGDGGDATATFDLLKGEQGIWALSVEKI